MIDISLAAAFIAGLITFIAPCTLPLVPGYLAFISGIPSHDLADPMKRGTITRRVFVNGLFFVLGFSFIFIAFGSTVGLLGGFLAPYQIWLNRVGGILIVVFGLMMMNIVRIPFLSAEHRISPPSFLKTGKPTSSFLLGSAFATGWTPCVGPVLGAILTLSAISEGALQGAFLLSVFSAGLAVPFLVIALTIGSAAQYIQKISRYLGAFSVTGGLFLVFLGVLLFIGKLGLLITWGYALLRFLGFETFEERLLDFL